jgi:hypothetical protein
MIQIKCFLLFILLSLSSSVFASSPLYEHVQAIGQTMSALYMHGLSEGNEKYQRELNLHKKKADKTLAAYAKEAPEQAAKLQASWDKIKHKIIISYSEDFGWDIDAYVRADFRRYQGDVYSLSSTQKNIKPSQQEQYQLALLQLESIIARFYDIASVYDGMNSFNPQDLEKLDPKIINQEFKATLDALAEKSSNKAHVKSLKSAKYKWQFIEESVTDYNDQSAYFLVYATKKKISKVLNAGIKQLTNKGR